LAGALTLSGGSSIGAVPGQRRWYLGGTQTIRGEAPDTARSGNAFWMTRTELGRNFEGMRAVVFSDLGWVGDRTRLREVGRPLSGVGVGASFLDGLIRFDLARGIYPGKQWRFTGYLDGVF
jgi:hemolysin activation/secretion protein